jgi:hypothetical protein
MAETKIEELARLLRESVERGGGTLLPENDYEPDSWNHVRSYVDPETGLTVDRYERAKNGIKGVMEIPRQPKE